MRCTHMGNDSCHHFDVSLLQAISGWQRGGDAKQNKRRGQTLKQACASLPERYRTCALDCFRQIALPKGGVWDLLGVNHLSEKISSWTVDLEVAQTIKNGVPPEGQGYQGVIFSIKPPLGSVIVNLWELYQDPAFLDALKKNKVSIMSYAAGAGRYMNSQSEVVLELDELTQVDIYSLGGHSSAFDEVVSRAASIIYGRSPTPEEVKLLLLKVEHLRGTAGARWLTPAATARVLDRTRPEAAKLIEIKRCQASGGADSKKG